MGQKANPIDIRLGITTKCPSTWFASGKAFAKNLATDIRLRKYLETKLKEACVSRVEIERGAGITAVTILSGKPGMIIGRSGSGMDDLKKDLRHEFGENFDINVREVKNADTDARVLADMIGRALERRMAFRRAAKMAVQKAIENGAKGVRIQLGGRLAGADIARSETFREGNVPLHTFRADIDYATDRGETTYGTIGIKVWVYNGDVFKRKLEA